MGRLRATLARSDIDREMHLHLANASRSLQLALDLCVRMARARAGEDDVVYNPVEVRRARQYANVLRQARNLMSGVGHLTPMVDLSDPDLLPESAKKAPVVPKAVVPAEDPMLGEDDY